jgi:hypothetical protein
MYRVPRITANLLLKRMAHAVAMAAAPRRGVALLPPHDYDFRIVVARLAHTILAQLKVNFTTAHALSIREHYITCSETL